VNRAAWVAAAGLTLLLFALLFDAGPLFVPGVAFTLLGVGTPAWIAFAARGARVDRELHADRVVEEEPLEATIEVSRGPWGLPGGELRDPLAGTPVSLRGWLSPITGDRTANVRVVARFARRGRISVEPPSLIVRDPLDLARTVRRGRGPSEEVLVLPRTERVRWVARELVRPDPNAGRTPEPLAATEVDGLRPYRPGTSASRIHWPALARGAGLLERRLQADGDARPLVVLDNRCAGPSEYLDAAVRAAASLVLELARHGGCSLLLPGDRRPLDIDRELGNWPGAHVRLALVEAEPERQAPALAAGAHRGRLFYVAAQPTDRLPANVASGCKGVGTLVLPILLTDGIGLPGAFEVCGCRGFLLGARSRSPVRERVA
jgi:uncharacterized protein (DUF58 family)